MSSWQLNKNSKWVHFKKISAFTLAEVLITLGIIGVVAALTIPTLMNKAQNQGFVSGMKKGLSELSQANSLLIAESGSLTGAVDSYGSLTDALKSKLKIIKYCPKNQNAGECFPSTVTNLLGEPFTKILNYETPTIDQYNRMVLADGSSIVVADPYAADWCQSNYRGLPDSCGVVILDVNGLNRPNQVGRDIFYFDFDAQGKVIPFGSLGFWDVHGSDDYIGYSDYWPYCNPNYGSGSLGDAGWACAGRILKDGGMKY